MADMTSFYAGNCCNLHVSEHEASGQRQFLIGSRPTFVPLCKLTIRLWNVSNQLCLLFYYDYQFTCLTVA